MSESGHGGLAVSKALKALGVDRIFTLSGGHIFPIFDGCKQDGIQIIDVRHEQTAAFAAEAHARLTRSLGVAVVTAGPGVTNVMSPLAQARFNAAPVLVLGGRAPSFRWGQGSLQEIDHVPFVDPLATATTVTDTADVARAVVEAGLAALTPPRGPRFLDFPLDVLFNNAEFEVPDATHPQTEVDPKTIDEIVALLDRAERPIVIAGSNVWLDGAENELIGFVEAAEVPVFMNGQGRGTVPADHRLAFSRARSHGLKEADLVIVAGTPMDFRLGFGQFAGNPKIVHLDASPAEHVDLAAKGTADLRGTFRALAGAIDKTPDTKSWVEALRATEDSKRDAAQAELHNDQSPIHPMRIYGELVPLLKRDTIVVCDGGDFVSYAGREVPSFEGGRWLDPGPYGCLGVGPGYALAAAKAHPDKKVVLLYGDGAVGFSLGDLESIVRHGLPVVCVVGNNGIWGLEKHPMRALYGYDVAADLRPGIRYDQTMESFGGKGALVTEPSELGPALKTALEADEPYLVNVLTDPEVAYPRSSNLA